MLAGVRRIPLSMLFASFFVLAACDDDTTSPALADADPEVARAVMDSVVQSYFEDNPSVLSANGPLGGFITAITGLQPAVAPALDLSTPGSVSGSTFRATRDAFRLFPSIALGGGPLASSIPTGLVGATCIWNFDPVSPNWADDTSRRGLCGTGNCIRFALYPLGVDGLPSSQTETGYMDITDESSLQNIDVSIFSQVDGATRLDYGVTGTLTETTINLTMSGSVSDGASSLPLDLTISGNQTTYTTTYSLTAGGLDISYAFSFDEAAGFSYVFGIVDGSGDELRLILGIESDGSIATDSRVTLNNNTIATISGTSETVTVTPTSESGLTELQAAGFVSLFGAAQEGLFQIGGLFNFAMANTGRFVYLFF
jgi:hypothetical protein